MQEVYLISTDNAVKIGISSNITKRLLQLQTGNPIPLSLIGTISCVNAKKKEKELHTQYLSHKLKGEWFDLKIVDEIIATHLTSYNHNYKFEVTSAERYDIIDNAGDSAFMLYQYFLRMAAIPDAPMEDDNAAKYFSWSKRKVANNRKLLEALGYFKKITYCSRKGKRSVTYYLTKPRVEKA